jgi:2-dehydropantoate 2-reductase
MRLAVYGVGAIGGVVGAGLAEADEDVVLVDLIPEHVAAMNASGLRVRSATSERRVTVRAALPNAVTSLFDLVFLAVKIQHTQAALESLAATSDLTRPSCRFRMDSTRRRSARRIGVAPTIGAMVDFSADYHAPGLIQIGRLAEVYEGELDGRMNERLEAVRRVLGRAVPTRSTSKVLGYVWAKLCKGSLDVTTAWSTRRSARPTGTSRRNARWSRWSGKWCV